MHKERKPCAKKHVTSKFCGGIIQTQLYLVKSERLHKLPHERLARYKSLARFSVNV